MIDGLIAGRLYGKPEQRISQHGRPFVVAKARVIPGKGETLFLNVVAFDEAPSNALLALDDGDSVAMSGSLTPKVWITQGGEARPSLDMVAHRVLSAFVFAKKPHTTRAVS